MDRDDVRAYYEQYGEREWERLTRQEDGFVELTITTHILGRHLSPDSRVLDLGGGPGRYTIWLAQQGHRVTLADLSPRLLEIARREILAAGVEERVEGVVEADARDLSRWADDSFDAVVALGPFYHLPDATDRERAAADLARVLRSGGRAFVALMPRQAFLRRVIAVEPERHLLARPDFLDRLLETGEFVNDRPGAFTGGYGVRPDEVAPFFARHGFEQLALLAAESIVPDLQADVAAMQATDPAQFRAALDALVRVAGDPSILGMSNHLLYVGQKV